MKLTKGWGWAVALGATLTLGAATTVTAKAAVPDVSEWQGRLTDTQVKGMKPHVSFIINRVQYGLGHEDKFQRENEAKYVKHGVPFGSYDFATFWSPSTARKEARLFYQRANKKSRFYVLDFEMMNAAHPMSVKTANASVEAWRQEMRKLTKNKKHLIFYSYEYWGTAYADTARRNFDAQWIARYAKNAPTIPFSLWQNTDHHYVPGLKLYVDNSVFGKTITKSSYHPLSWWIGAKKKAAVKKTPVKKQPVKKAPTKQVTTKKVTKTAYSHYQVGQRATIHPRATKFYGGQTITTAAKQRPYKITKVRALTTGRSKQIVYLGAVKQWIRAQDITGYWASGREGKVKLRTTTNIYQDGALKSKTGRQALKGKTYLGQVVRVGNLYRVKLNRGGYITAKVTTGSFKVVKYVFSAYEAGQAAYLKSGARTYVNGRPIAANLKHRAYRITKVRHRFSQRSKQTVYLRGVNRWVRAQDINGYWRTGRHFELRRAANVYHNVQLTKKTTTKLAKHTLVNGHVVKHGHTYRIKLAQGGFITANANAIMTK